VPEAGRGGEGEDRHRDRDGLALVEIAALGAVEHGAGEHERQNRERFVRVDPAAVEQHQDHDGPGRQHSTKDLGQPEPGHRERDPGHDQQVGDLGHEPGAEEAAGDGLHGQEPAQDHPGHRETERVPAAALVRPGHEQRGEQQVEGHLVGEGPDHADDVSRAEHVGQHERVGEQGRLTVVVGPADAAQVQLPERDRCDQREYVEREQPEQPADPEPADAALALQGRRHDVAADQEEDEHAELARVEPLVDVLAGVLEHGVAKVVEHHGQGRHPPQRIQPREPPSWRNWCAGRGGWCGMGTLRRRTVRHKKSPYLAPRNS
jgi:hypothetical protein